jgi:polar amino acid transport system substrate-binding protein
VPPGSPFRAVDEVDRAGVRIGISAKSAYDLYLSRTIKHAELVRGTGPDAAFNLLIEGKVDVVAGVRQHLDANLAKLAGARVFADRFMAIQQALGIQKGRAEGAKYLRAFIEDVKASGFVSQVIAKSGVQGVLVAPPVALL